MTLEPSAWRASDAVLFEVAREAASDAIAKLFRLSDTGAIDPTAAVDEAAAIRLDLVDIDGFDREAVESFLRRTADRLQPFSGANQ